MRTKAYFFAAATACASASAVADGDATYHGERIDHPHKWYRDRDVPVIKAVLQSQLASTLNEHNGIDTFKIDTPEDDEDMTHDVVSVKALPGWGPGVTAYICEALQKLYWQSGTWKMVTYGTLGGGPVKMECIF
jgi:hypothetical protein